MGYNLLYMLIAFSQMIDSLIPSSTFEHPSHVSTFETQQFYLTTLQLIQYNNPFIILIISLGRCRITAYIDLTSLMQS